MRKKILTFFVLTAIFSQVVVLAQPLSGTYTIGGSSPNYNTIANAITALSAGVTGPVVFNIRSGTYLENITLNAITGVSASNTVTFKSESNDSTSVVITKLLSGSPLININGADYVIFKKITFQVGAGSSSGQLVQILTGSDNISFQNNRFLGATTGITTYDHSIVYSSSGLKSYNEFKYNRFENGAYGIYYYGSSSSYSNNFTIRENVFVNQYTSALELRYINNLIVQQNKMETNSSNSSYKFIGLQNCDNTATIKNNTMKFKGTTTASSAYGIYATAGTSNLFIQGNYIYFGSGKGRYGIYLNSLTGCQIENNLIQVGYPSTSYGIALDLCYSVNIYYNSVNVNAQSSSSSALYINNSTTNNAKDNIFANNGTGYSMYLNNYASNTFTSSNYNDFYTTGSVLIYKSGSLTLSGWQSYADANSREANPFFANDSTFLPRTYQLDNTGIPVSGVSIDYNGVTRPYTTPDIGAYEFSVPAHDAGVIDINNNFTVCDNNGSSENILVKIKNFGTSTLTSAVIHYSVDGMTPSTYNWSGSLAQGNTSNDITIGTFPFSIGSTHQVLAWTSNPNNNNEGYTYNDSLLTSPKFVALSGNYTIGGTSPNFTTINQAITCLNNSGVCGPVVFNIRSGIYWESLNLSQITGASTVNTVTFQSEALDSTQVVISDLLTSNALVNFNGADYITFKKLCFEVGSGSTYGWLVKINNGSNYNNFLNNWFKGSTTGNTTDSYSVFYSDTYDKDNIQIINNQIDNGSYGIYLQSSGSYYSDYITISGNIIKNQTYYGMYLRYLNYATISNNVIETNTTYSSYRFISMTYSNYITLNKNIINYTGTSQLSSGYGMELTNMNTSTITRNKIVLGQNSGRYGIYLYSSYTSYISNNLIEAGYNSSTYGLYFDSDNYIDLYYNTVKVFSTSSSAAPLYVKSTYYIKNKNNIYYTDNGTCIYLYENNSSTFDASDYNCFYTLNTYPFYRASSYSFASWQSYFDNHSVFANPYFENYNSFLTRNYLLDEKGIPVAGVNIDYNGITRPLTTPDIGSYEFDIPVNDAGIVDINNGLNLCDNNNNSDPISVKIKNFGTSNLTSVQVNWSIDGVNQTPYIWNGNLLQGQTSSSIVIGSYNFTLGSSHNIFSWTSIPNTATEGYTYNDSLKISNKYLSLNGSYTIGGNAPTFTTLNQAITALNNGGICGSVVFNIRSGSYYESLYLYQINGCSSGNTITFQSESGDSTSVTIFSLLTSYALIEFNGADYINFRKLTLQVGSGSNIGKLINIGSGSNYNNFESIWFRGSNTGTADETNAIVYSASSYYKDNISFTKCLFESGSYGVYFYGSSGTYNQSLYINNNTFQNQVLGAVDIKYQNNYQIKNNIMTSNSSNSSWKFINLYYVSYGDVSRNSMEFTGPSASSSYGIYVSNSTGSLSINKNKLVYGAGKGRYGIYLYSVNVATVANNLVQLGYNSTSYGIALDQSYYIDLFYNCVKLTSSGSSGSALYVNSGSGINSKNNIFSNFGSGYATYYYGSYGYSYFTSSDYNCLYNTTNYPVYSNNTQMTLPSWQSYFDNHSIISNPYFENINLFVPRQYLINSAGIPVNGISDDYNGTIRPVTFPDIGAYEFIIPSADAGIYEINSSNILCDNNGSSENNIVKIKNYGTSPLTSATINWVVNGATQTPYVWTGYLLQGQVSPNISIGNFSYNIGSTYSITAWTSLPNNSTEGFTYNDTIQSVQDYLSLSGTYTIGGSNPTFATINAAITALQNGGICGPVNFKIRNGTYYESINLTTIEGASNTNTITFESESGLYSTVTISNFITGNGLIFLNGTDYITFKNLTFEVGSGSTIGRIAYINTGCDYVSFLNNRFKGSTNGGTAAENAIIYFPSGASNVLTCNNNIFEDGSYGLYLWGTSGYYINYLTANNNTFTNQVSGSVYLKYNRYFNLTNNTLNSNTTNSSFSFINITYCSDNCNITGNSLNYSGSSSMSSSYGIYIDNTSNNINISKNSIIFGANSGKYGIYAYSSSDLMFSNNIVQLGSSNTVYGIYLYSCSSPELYYNSVNILSTSSSSAAYYNRESYTTYLKDNIFANASSGYAMYLYSYNSSYFATGGINYNCYYTNGTNLIYASSNYNLNQWKSLGYDQVSIQINPQFFSSVNLRTCNTTIAHGGVQVPGVPDDYEGNLRNFYNPSIGAFEIDTMLVVELGNNVVFCNGSFATLDAGTGGTNYLWSNGSTTQTINVSQAGYYYVTVSNACGSNTDNIQVFASPSTLSVNLGNDTAFCAGSSILLNAGNPGSTYNWSNGATTQTINALTSNFYTVTVTNTCGNQTDGINIMVYNLATNAGMDQNIMFGNSTILAASSSGGYLPVTYTWSPVGLSGQNITVTPLINTAYTLTAVDALGCTATDIVNVSVTGGSPIAVTITGNSAACSGTSVQLTAHGTGGTGSFIYHWSPGNLIGNTVSFNPISNTTYYVTATDAYTGYSSVAQFSVSMYPNPIVIATGESEICKGDNAVILASATGGSGSYSYHWLPGIISGQTISVSPASSTLYTAEVTDSHGCVGTGSINVVVNTNPVIIAGANSIICQGEPALLSVSAYGGSGTYTFNWSNGQLGQNVTVYPASSVIYSVIVADSNTCSDTSFVSVTVNPLPVVNPGASQNVCAGNSVTLSGVAGGNQGSYTYNWQPGNINSQTAIFTVNQSSTFTLFATDNNACTGSGSVYINVYENPVAYAGSDVEICIGNVSTLNASASGGNGNYSYYWLPGNLVGQNITVNPATNTTYTLHVSDLHGCLSSDAVDVIVNPKPSLITLGDSEICYGDQTVLMAQASGGTGNYSYSWSNGAVGSAVSFYPASTSMYVVTVSDENGCTESAGMSVVVHPVPLVLTDSPISVCVGSQANLVGMAAGGTSPYSYVWTPGNLPGSSVNLTITVSSEFNMVVSDIFGCSATGQVDVTALPIPVANAGIDQTIMSGSQTSLIGTASSGDGDYTFIWNPGLIFGETIIVQPTVSTTFLLTVTDGNFCSSYPDAVNVFIGYDDLIVDAGVDTSVCAGTSYLLSASVNGGSGDYTITWEPGNLQGQQVLISPVETSVYTLTVIDNSTLLFDTSQISITILPLPLANAGSDQVICSGQETLLFGTASGSGNVTYLWNPGQITGNAVYITPLYDIEYLLEITDESGCVGTDTMQIVVNISPIVNAGNAQTICENDSITLMGIAIGGAGNYSYTWNPGNYSGNIVTVAPFDDTFFTLSVVDQNLCETSAEVLVTVNDNPVVPVIYQIGDSLYTDLADAYQWYNNMVLMPGANTQGIALDRSGYFSVEVYNEYGCSSISDPYHFIFSEINDIANAIKINLYPNPVNDICNLEIEGLKNETSIALYSINGDVMKQFEPVRGSEVKLKIDFSEYSSGIYVIRMNDGDIQKQVSIIKE